MQADWDRFAVEAQQAAADLGVAEPVATSEAEAADELPDYTGADRKAEVAVRIGQYSFRRAVLSAYDNRCCITGLAVPSLLVASHIKRGESMNETASIPTTASVCRPFTTERSTWAS